MGVLSDARRRTGRYLREHEGLLDKASDRVKAAAGEVLDRAGARAGTGRLPKPSRTPSSASRPSKSSPRPSSRTGGPSVSRVREQADRLASGVSRIGTETEVEQLVRENTKAELMRRAHELEIKGRSRMTKQQLAEEIAGGG